MNNYSHEEQVYAFLKSIKESNPETYEQYSEKYPILSATRIRRLRRRERCVGLLGLQPVNLPSSILSKYNMEGIHEE